MPFEIPMARGQTRTGWLDSRPTFSFGHYQAAGALVQTGRSSLDLVDPAQVGGPSHQLLARRGRNEVAGRVRGDIFRGRLRARNYSFLDALPAGRMRSKWWVWLSHGVAPPLVDAPHRTETVGEPSVSWFTDRSRRMRFRMSRAADHGSGDASLGDRLKKSRLCPRRLYRPSPPMASGSCGALFLPSACGAAQSGEWDCASLTAGGRRIGNLGTAEVRGCERQYREQFSRTSRCIRARRRQSWLILPWTEGASSTPRRLTNSQLPPPSKGR